MGKRIDHTGKTYNYLTALRFSRVRIRKSGGRTTLWLFKCICGREYEGILDNVVHGNTKSCGCMRQRLIAESQILPNFQEVFNRAYATHLDAAKRRGYTSALTLEQYTNISKSPCAYCGGFSSRKTQALQRIKNRQRFNAGVVNANSVDRENNEPFYTLQNSVPCCFICQKMKGTLSKEEFKKQIKKIVSFIATGDK